MLIGGLLEFVTGDAPQPGETPRKESNPWTFSDADTGFWPGDADREPEGAVAGESARHPRRGPSTQAATLTPPAFSGEEKQRTGEAAEAHVAGGQDAVKELAPAQQTETKPAEQRRNPDKTERDHVEVDGARFNPLISYASTTPTAPKDQPVHSEETPAQAERSIPVPQEAPAEAEPVRPTVAVDRPAAPSVPPQPPTGLSRLAQAAQRPPSPLLETSTFWLTEEQRAERAATAPTEEVRERLTRPDGSPKRRPRSTRRPAAGLVALVALALIASFFAWVSAEPFWLAVGHGDSGVATVAQCTGDGVAQRCAGQFQARNGAYAVTKVTLLGVTPGQRNPGAISPARMVSRTSHQAYVGETGLLVQLRWLLGFLLVLLCGFGIAALTGARRLETAGARRGALIMSVAGPVLLLAGFLAVTY